MLQIIIFFKICLGLPSTELILCFFFIDPLVQILLFEGDFLCLCYFGPEEGEFPFYSLLCVFMIFYSSVPGVSCFISVFLLFYSYLFCSIGLKGTAVRIEISFSQSAIYCCKVLISF
jgi:hypothetical protein